MVLLEEQVLSYLIVSNFVLDILIHMSIFIMALIKSYKGLLVVFKFTAKASKHSWGLCWHVQVKFPTESLLKYFLILFTFPQFEIPAVFVQPIKQPKNA